MKEILWLYILIQRSIASLASNKALMVTEEPGTAKNYLSEFLASAICGISINTIQVSASITEINNNHC